MMQPIGVHLSVWSISSPTDPTGRSCQSIQAGRGTGNLQGPPDTSLHVRRGCDHTVSPLGRDSKGNLYMNYWSV